MMRVVVSLVLAVLPSLVASAQVATPAPPGFPQPPRDTSAQLAAIPIPDPRENRARERPIVAGEPPNPVNPPSGCRFHTRCPRATEICRRVEPRLTAYSGGHLAACHHPQNVSDDEIRASTRSEDSPLSSGDEPPGAED